MVSDDSQNSHADPNVPNNPEDFKEAFGKLAKPKKEDEKYQVSSSDFIPEIPEGFKVKMPDPSMSSSDEEPQKAMPKLVGLDGRPLEPEPESKPEPEKKAEPEKPKSPEPEAVESDVKLPEKNPEDEKLQEKLGEDEEKIRSLEQQMIDLKEKVAGLEDKSNILEFISKVSDLTDQLKKLPAAQAAGASSQTGQDMNTWNLITSAYESTVISVESLTRKVRAAHEEGELFADQPPDMVSDWERSLKVFTDEVTGIQDRMLAVLGEISKFRTESPADKHFFEEKLVQTHDGIDVSGETAKKLRKAAGELRGKE